MCRYIIWIPHNNRKYSQIFSRTLNQSSHVEIYSEINDIFSYEYNGYVTSIHSIRTLLISIFMFYISLLFWWRKLFNRQIILNSNTIISIHIYILISKSTHTHFLLLWNTAVLWVLFSFSITVMHTKIKNRMAASENALKQKSIFLPIALIYCIVCFPFTDCSDALRIRDGTGIRFL